MSQADVTEVTRAQGRPRSTRAHQAILDAVLELWNDGVTVDALSIEAVAARAGVGKATIYRRWANKQELLRDAMLELKGPPDQPVGDNVRDRLLSLVSKIGIGDERASRMWPCLMPEIMRSDAAYEMWQTMVEPRREVLRQVLRDGIADGELRSDIDLDIVSALLVSPVLLNRTTRWHPGLDNESLPEQVVDTVLAGIRRP